MLLKLSTAAMTLAAALGIAVHAPAVRSPKALVYCPANIDATGCNTVVAALSGMNGPFAAGVDRAYDGTSGTVDLATADLSQYSALIIPSLADNALTRPYDLLRDSLVARRLRQSVGWGAVWSGTPDQGSASRAEKDALLRNLAVWASGRDSASPLMGAVVLQDHSADVSQRYGWLESVAGLRVAADTTMQAYAQVQSLDAVAAQILTSGDTSLAYANMASFGLRQMGGGVIDAVGVATPDLGVASAIRTTRVPALARAVVAGGGGSGPTVMISFIGQPAPTLVVNPASGSYGGAVALQATLTSASAVVPNRAVSFRLNGTLVGAAVTNGSGVAVLANVPLGTINAGSYPSGIAATFAGDATYPGASARPAALTVTPRATSLAVARATGSYGGTTTLSATLEDDGGLPVGGAAIAFTLAGHALLAPAVTNARGVATLSDVSLAGIDAGDHASGVAASFAPQANYNGSTGSAALAVDRIGQAITFGPLANRVYGDPAFAVSAAANSGLPVSIGASGNCSITGGGASSAAWMVSMSGTGICALTASQAGDDRYTAAADVTQSFAIGRAVLTVKADDKRRTYGAQSPVLTASYSGFVDGETVAVVSGTLTLGGPGANTTASTPVGGYAVVPGGVTSSNYVVEFVPGTLRIDPAALTVTADDQRVTYGATPSYTARYAGFIDGDGASSLGGTLGLSTAGASGAVGAYPIVPSGVTSSNYDIGFANGTLTVARAPLTVTASSKATVYGTAIPSLDGTITGFVLGEDQRVLTAQPSYATAATATSSVAGGPYAIVASGASAANYSFVYVNGALAITRASQTIAFAPLADRINGDAPFAVSASASSGLPISALTAAGDCDLLGSTVATRLLPSGGTGRCTVTASQAGDGNYNAAPSVARPFAILRNAPPVVGPITASTAAPIPVGSSITVNSSFSDADVPQSTPYRVSIDWGDGSAPTLSTASAPGVISGSHAYQSAGVWTVTVTASDKIPGNIGSNTYLYVVAYDNTGGFVTGGGWINAPAGSYPAGAALTGKSTFGFNAKYKKGASVPDGNTEFQFHPSGLNFKASSYDWLVVNGAKLQYKGSGTVNGAGGYAFMFTAIDSRISGGSADQARLKIWEKATGKVIFDNEIGVGDDVSPTTALQGGNITIHN